MKHHIWKLGVVFTDNVSIEPGKTSFCAPGSGVVWVLRETSRGRWPGKLRTQSLSMWGTLLPVQSGMADGLIELQNLNPLEPHFVPQTRKNVWMSRSSSTNAWKGANFFHFQSFLYLAWYTTMSVLGHYNNFFFAAHLLDIAMGFKTLRTILSSVTHNGKQVLGSHRLKENGLEQTVGCVPVCWEGKPCNV
jgi:hypothetical protein